MLSKKNRIFVAAWLLFKSYNRNDYIGTIVYYNAYPYVGKAQNFLSLIDSNKISIFNDKDVSYLRRIILRFIRLSKKMENTAVRRVLDDRSIDTYVRIYLKIKLAERLSSEINNIFLKIESSVIKDDYGLLNIKECKD